MQNSIQSTVTQLEASPTQSTATQFEASPTYKAVYTPPVLTIYGSVSELTMEGGGSNTDGFGGNGPN